MIKKYCDRCDKEIPSNYYTARLGCVEDEFGLLSTEGLNLNISENTRELRMLCRDCIFEIKNFIDKPIKRVDKTEIKIPPLLKTTTFNFFQKK